MRPVTPNASADALLCSSVVASLLDMVDDEILVMTPQGDIISANRRFCKVRGLDRQGLIGRPAAEIFRDEPGGPGKTSPNNSGKTSRPEPFAQVIQTQKPAQTTYTIPDIRGRARTVQLTAYPVCDAEGEISLVAEIRRDITHTRHIERQLQQSERLVAIGELSSYVAHEIRNPLFTISGFANSLLRSSSLDATAREKARVIVDQSKRLDTILNSFSDFVRPTASEAEEVDLHETVRDVVSIVLNKYGMAPEQSGNGGGKGQISRKEKVEVALSFDPDLPLVAAQGERLKQILINLLNNAFEAMPEGGSLSITTFMDREMVCLTLADTGHGIPDDLLPNVFNPFVSTKDKGAGLGLPQSRKMLDDLGGEIELHSTPDVGTTATLRLPPVLADSR
jgi:signal transduction histidine kinase